MQCLQGLSDGRFASIAEQPLQLSVDRDNECVFDSKRGYPAVLVSTSVKCAEAHLVWCVQHVAQCELLPRGEGPSPDIRVGTQLNTRIHGEPSSQTHELEHAGASL